MKLIIKGHKGLLRYAVMFFGVVLVVSAAMGADKDDGPAIKITEQSCGGCHGIDGNSVSPGYPKLSAQVPQYLNGQLHDFASGARTSPIMSVMAKSLSNTQIKELAEYFSQQTNKNSAQPNAQLVAQGKKIYHGGVSASKVPACAACHGSKAAGMPPLFPRLAGQNSAYVENQLEAFRSKKRSNDPNAMMRDIAAKLTTKEMKAVAAYMSSLR